MQPGIAFSTVTLPRSAGGRPSPESCVKRARSILHGASCQPTRSDSACRLRQHARDLLWLIRHQSPASNWTVDLSTVNAEHEVILLVFLVRAHYHL